MKENDKIGYVYLTTNLLNGKQYVGQHLHDGFDNGYKGSGNAIKAAFKKYGWDNFTCEVLQWCATQTQLNEVEDNCIRLYGTMVPNGYNLKGGGANGRYSEEARGNISKAKKGKKLSEESRKRNSVFQKKFRESAKGKEVSKKQSETMKKYYENEENRKKMSEIKVNYYKSEEGKEKRKKQSTTMKNYYKSKDGIEFRKKQSKKVYQYNLNGEFVKEWSSLSEIGRVLGYNIGAISYCCNGKQKSSYKHLWKFAS